MRCFDPRFVSVTKLPTVFFGLVEVVGTMRRLRQEPTWENVSYSELRCAAYAELLGDKSIAEPWIVNSQVPSVRLGTW